MVATRDCRAGQSSFLLASDLSNGRTSASSFPPLCPASSSFARPLALPVPSVDARQILKGNLLTVYGSSVLRLNSWASHHPGGELVLQHFVGRDATDEIDAYHSDHTLNQRINKFCVGKLAEEEREVCLRPVSIVASVPDNEPREERSGTTELTLPFPPSLRPGPTVVHFARSSCDARLPTVTVSVGRPDMGPARWSDSCARPIAGVPTAASPGQLALVRSTDPSAGGPVPAALPAVAVLARDPKEAHDCLPNAPPAHQASRPVHGPELPRRVRGRPVAICRPWVRRTWHVVGRDGCRGWNVGEMGVGDGQCGQLGPVLGVSPTPNESCDWLETRADPTLPLTSQSADVPRA